MGFFLCIKWSQWQLNSPRPTIQINKPLLRLFEVGAFLFVSCKLRISTHVVGSQNAWSILHRDLSRFQLAENQSRDALSHSRRRAGLLSIFSAF